MKKFNHRVTPFTRSMRKINKFIDHLKDKAEELWVNYQPIWFFILIIIGACIAQD